MSIRDFDKDSPPLTTTVEGVVLGLLGSLIGAGVSVDTARAAMRRIADTNEVWAFFGNLSTAAVELTDRAVAVTDSEAPS